MVCKKGSRNSRAIMRSTIIFRCMPTECIVRTKRSAYHRGVFKQSPHEYMGVFVIWFVVGCPDCFCLSSWVCFFSNWVCIRLFLHSSWVELIHPDPRMQMTCQSWSRCPEWHLHECQVWSLHCPHDGCITEVRVQDIRRLVASGHLEESIGRAL